jgi:hypothetical protein
MTHHKRKRRPMGDRISSDCADWKPTGYAAGVVHHLINPDGTIQTHATPDIFFPETSPPAAEKPPKR